MKYFFSGNLALEEADKAPTLNINESMTGFDTKKGYRKLRTIHDAVDALMNFDLCWSEIHPLDYGSRNIVRFLIKKIHHPDPQKRIIRVDVIERFFEAAFKGTKQRILL